jgi:hypothetical protein
MSPIVRGHQARDAVGSRVRRPRDGPHTPLRLDGGAERTDIAEVARSAMGSRDDRGDFRALASVSALAEVGVGFPPYHGHCCTTTLAVV